MVIHKKKKIDKIKTMYRIFENVNLLYKFFVRSAHLRITPDEKKQSL